MTSLMEYESELLLPISKYNIDFYLKPEYSLNDFDLFILNSINELASLDNLANATLLTPNAIQIKINSLIDSGLLDEEFGEYKITTVSEKILLASNWLLYEWKNNKTCYYNKITMQFDRIYDDQIVTDVQNNNQHILNSFKNSNFDNKNIYNNLDEYISLFEELNFFDEKEKSEILECLYVQLNKFDTKEKHFKVLPIKYFPCFITKNVNLKFNYKIEKDKRLYAKGELLKISIILNNSFFIGQEEKIEQLKLNDNYNSLSANDLFLINMYDDYIKLKGKQLGFYYDYSSKIYDKFENYYVKEPKKSNLDLNIIEDISRFNAKALRRIALNQFEELKTLEFDIKIERIPSCIEFSLNLCEKGDV